MSEEVKLLEELRPVGDGYCVSNTGRIIGSKGKELQPRVRRDGYVQVNLYRGGKRCTLGAHRIVAQAFCDNPDPSICDQIDHINGVKLDNRAANLRWVDAKTNMRARYELRERLGLPRRTPAEEEGTKKAAATRRRSCGKLPRVEKEERTRVRRQLPANLSWLRKAIEQTLYTDSNAKN